MLWVCFKSPSCLFGNTRDMSLMHEKAKCVCFIYMQPQKVNFKFVQINMKQVSYLTARNCKFLKCTFVRTCIGLACMKKVFKKNYLDIHSPGKSDKNGIFDVVTSCSIFDKFIFLKNTF